MKTYLLIGGLVLVAGVMGFLAISKGSPANNNVAAVVESQNDQSNKASLREMLAISNPQKCNFEDSTEMGKTEGIVYVSNGKMRGDFTSSVQGQTITGHMIIADNTMNSWTDSYPTGVTMTLDASDNQANGFNPDKKVDFSCTDWSVDESMFITPKEITFQNINSFMAVPETAQ